MANFFINKAILGGRLTADVELKTTPSGVSVCSFSLAINRKYSSNEGQQETDFIECKAWRQTAEFISRYFKKGSSLCVVGSIQKRMWKDQQGNNRYATEVIVDEAMFVDSKNDAQGTFTTPDAQFNAPSYDAPQTANFETLDVDADLPF